MTYTLVEKTGYPTTRIEYEVVWQVIPMENKHEHGNRYVIRRRTVSTLEQVKAVFDEGINEHGLWKGPDYPHDFTVLKRVISEIELDATDELVLGL